MPAPAVYVLAIVGTVGAVIAFKEFVYEPHIAPHIDRWKAEYEASRRRRDLQRQDNLMVPIPMSSSTLPSSSTRTRHIQSTHHAKDRNADKYSDKSDSDSDEDRYGRPDSYGADKHRTRQAIGTGTGVDSDIELESLLAREAREWRNDIGAHGLRLRKNVSAKDKDVSGHAMDESIHNIPYVSLSPSRPVQVNSDTASASRGGTPPTHVIADSLSPETPSTTIHTPSSTKENLGLGLLSMSHSPSFAPPLPSPPLPPLPSSPAPDASSTNAQTMTPTGVLANATYPPPQVSPYQHMITNSILFFNDESATTSGAPTNPFNPRTGASPPLPPLPPSHSPPSRFSPPPLSSPNLYRSIMSFSSNASLNAITVDDSTSAFITPPLAPSSTAAATSSATSSPNIPSLSQTYPQDLDQEHGLELLSPPSSRSDSPFSVVQGTSSPYALSSLSGLGSPPTHLNNFAQVNHASAASPYPGGYGAASPGYMSGTGTMSPYAGAEMSPYVGMSPFVGMSPVLSSGGSRAQQQHLTAGGVQRTLSPYPHPQSNSGAHSGQARAVSPIPSPAMQNLHVNLSGSQAFSTPGSTATHYLSFSSSPVSSIAGSPTLPTLSQLDSSINNNNTAQRTGTEESQYPTSYPHIARSLSATSFHSPSPPQVTVAASSPPGRSPVHQQASPPIIQLDPSLYPSYPSLPAHLPASPTNTSTTLSDLDFMSDVEYDIAGSARGSRPGSRAGSHASYSVGIEGEGDGVDVDMDDDGGMSDVSGSSWASVGR